MEIKKFCLQILLIHHKYLSFGLRITIYASYKNRRKDKKDIQNNLRS